MDYCIYCMEPLPQGAANCPACRKSQTYACPENRLPPGTVLNRRYQLGASLGQGGFGITYVARDLKLNNKVVAIKELYPHELVYRNNAYTANVTAVTQHYNAFENSKKYFLREVKILAALDDEPGIVDVNDYFNENNTVYFVMRFLRGETLKAYIRRVGRQSFVEAFELLRPVMKSLTAVHKKNIIHRDIAPDNIMLMRDGAKLFDFGISKDFSENGKMTSTVFHKPGYSPYEQYTKVNQGPWTDVYALCATLHYCVMGQPPKDAHDRMLDFMQNGNDSLPFDHTKFSPQVQKVMAKGLAILPEKRFQSVEELVQAIENAIRLDEREILPIPIPKPKPKPEPMPIPTPEPEPKPVPKPEPMPKPKPKPMPKPEPTPEKKKAKWPTVLVAVILVAALAGVGAWYFFGRGKNDKGDVVVGDYITFGSYEQDNDEANGKEPIEWLVLDREGDKALVVSKYALDCQPYNEMYKIVTWETCTLRTWLNDDFYHAAFSAAEQNRIVTTTVKNDDNPDYGTAGGNDTQDKVFLLSIDEANKYFASNEARQCVPTAYAEGQGVLTSDSYTAAGGAVACIWWLRSTGNYSARAYSVGSYGYMDYNYDVNYTGYGVRPAMWIHLES